MSNDQARRLLVSGEQGQTLVEYEFIIIRISIGTSAALTFMRESISGPLSQVGSML